MIMIKCSLPSYITECNSEKVRWAYGGFSSIQIIKFMISRTIKVTILTVIFIMYTN